MKLAACIFIKILQLIFCVATIIVKKLADKYSERMVKSNQKFLREWTLLNTISFTKESDEFSILTIIGFTFVSAVLLITRIIERHTNYHICENILLSCGVLFFTIQGLLIFGTVEELADSVSTYAFALGGLSFLCAFLFLIDLFIFRRMSKSKSVISQTDFESTLKTVYIPDKNAQQQSNNQSCAQACTHATINNDKTVKYLRTDL